MTQEFAQGTAVADVGKPIEEWFDCDEKGCKYSPNPGEFGSSSRRPPGLITRQRIPVDLHRAQRAKCVRPHERGTR